MSEVKVSASKLKELQRDQAKLRALECGGVDNWEWYDEALKEYRETIEHEENLEDMAEEIMGILSEFVMEPAGRGAGYGYNDGAYDAVLQFLKTKNVKLGD